MDYVLNNIHRINYINDPMLRLLMIYQLYLESLNEGINEDQ